MRISHYSFGRITIDGKTYTSDVIIYHDRVDSSWWRKEGHSLDVSDLTDIIDAMPDTIVIGTGYSGMMNVPEETVRFIRARGIDLHVARTEKAVDIFNNLPDERKAIAALHLTC